MASGWYRFLRKPQRGLSCRLKVDACSRYPEVIPLSSQSSNAAIKEMKATFARHGIHEEATEEEKKNLNRLLEVMREQKHGYVCDFKKVDRWKLQQETAKVNRVLKYVKTNNITETNKLIKGVSIVVAENLGTKVNYQNDMGTRQRGKNQEPWWKRRIQSDIKKIQSEISILQRKERGELRTDSKYTRLKEKY